MRTGVLVILALIFTVGCDNTTTTTPPAQTSAAPAAPVRFTAERIDMPSGVSDLMVYTDSKTGCQFLTILGGSGNDVTLIPHTCTEDKR
jgi:hypothetical protein